MTNDDKCSMTVQNKNNACLSKFLTKFNMFLPRKPDILQQKEDGFNVG